MAADAGSTRAQWGIVVLGIALAAAVSTLDRAPSFRPGGWTNVPITLVSSDALDLGCALDEKPFGLSCRYRGDGTARPDPKTRVLVPCLTTRRQLLLVRDLFGQPAVARRVQAGLARHVPRPDEKRFTARCRVRVLGRVHGVRIRFLATAAFGRPTDAWLVAPSRCTIAPPGP